MRLGIGSYSLGWAVAHQRLSATGIVDLAVQWGVHLVQLCNNLPPETFAATRLPGLKAYADARHIAIEFGAQGSLPEHLRRMIGIARQLASPILRVVVDTPDDHPSPQEVIARIREVQPDLRQANITLAIENHDRLPADSLASIINQLHGDHVGVCLDTANSLGVPEGPRQVVQALGPYVVNLHLKDFAVMRVPSMQGFVVEGRPTGEGSLDIPWLLDELNRFGNTRSAIIEVWTPPQQTIELTMAQELAWAARSVANARQWIKD